MGNAKKLFVALVLLVVLASLVSAHGSGHGCGSQGKGCTGKSCGCSSCCNTGTCGCNKQCYSIPEFSGISGIAVAIGGMIALVRKS
ncbi:hypothetical protein GAH_00203 [Geoglobus ahangari]|uniref:Uncharacterized protein n=1 Tax=Geoglobus ahangari TaxID=113653 RepID=A0A0F7IGP2_9EURY|nr:hypothetical protein [Geoglobus ahangari]AKG92440.1 hypothetical protein GAH_00203 [Geoglobus ahangari]